MAIDTNDMVLVHRVFRREFRLLPELVRAARGDTDGAARVRAHATELLGFLHHHHSGEDALIWPKLRARVAIESELVDRMEAQHEAVAARLSEAEALLAQWSGEAARGEQLAAALEQVAAVLVEHLDEEERSILPLVAGCFTQAEWGELGERGFASVAKNRRLATLGQILEDADEQERRAFLSHVPPPARLAWRIVGQRQYKRETSTIRSSLQV